MRNNVFKQKSFFFTKIFRRIFVLFAVSIISLVLFYSYTTVETQKKSSLEVLYSKTNTLTNFIALACNDAMLKDDMSFVVDYSMGVVKRDKGILQIIVTNTNNENVFISRNSWRVFTKRSQFIKSVENGKENFHIVEDQTLKKKVFYYTYPVKLPGLDWGYIHILYSLKSYDSSIQRFYKSTFLLLSLLFFATLIISYILAREMVLPILELTDVAEHVAKGNLHMQSNIKRNDEIGELASNFNTMITRLENSHEELEALVIKRTEELEELNRELDLRVKKAISENSQKEQMLIQQSRLAAMGEMIGNIAHQWRQPLNALSLVVQNIYYTYEIGDLDETYLNRSIAKSKKLTDAMSKTIDDFRNFFRPDKIEESFSVSERVTSVEELISGSYKSHNIMLKMELDESLNALGYPNEFSQVLLNILSNAKDAIIENKVEQPIVLIRSYAKEGHIFLEIEDNAGGIDSHIINQIFDPYFTTKEKNIGTGIGLYMSKMIIEKNMNGKISVCNGKKGALFTIEIAEGEKDEFNE